MDVANYFATQIIYGKFRFAQIQKYYPQFAKQTLAVLKERGYIIDANGNCIEDPMNPPSPDSWWLYEWRDPDF